MLRNCSVRAGYKQSKLGVTVLWSVEQKCGIPVLGFVKCKESICRTWISHVERRAYWICEDARICSVWHSFQDDRVWVLSSAYNSQESSILLRNLSEVLEEHWKVYIDSTTERKASDSFIYVCALQYIRVCSSTGPRRTSNPKRPPWNHICSRKHALLDWIARRWIGRNTLEVGKRSWCGVWGDDSASIFRNLIFDLKKSLVRERTGVRSWKKSVSMELGPRKHGQTLPDSTLLWSSGRAPEEHQAIGTGFANRGSLCQFKAMISQNRGIHSQRCKEAMTISIKVPRSTETSDVGDVIQKIVLQKGAYGMSILLSAFESLCHIRNAVPIDWIVASPYVHVWTTASQNARFVALWHTPNICLVVQERMRSRPYQGGRRLWSLQTPHHREWCAQTSKSSIHPLRHQVILKSRCVRAYTLSALACTKIHTKSCSCVVLLLCRTLSAGNDLGNSRCTLDSRLEATLGGKVSFIEI